MTSRKILLTGAGFSSNFGLPLASGVWGLIFNDVKVQSCNHIKDLMIDSAHPAVSFEGHKFNYESIYASVMDEGYAHKEEQSIFKKRIFYIFGSIFESLTIQNFSSPNSLNMCLKSLRHFVSLFSNEKSGDSGFIFTLNQDLFLERLFVENMISSPYVGNCLYNYLPSGNKNLSLGKTISELIKSSDFKNSDGLLPDDTGLQAKREKNNFDLTKNTPWYVKLHGSIGWNYNTSTSDDFPIVMGFNKKSQIDKIPLLKEYYQIFLNQLSCRNTDLLIVGYSFSDQHINELIVHAIINFEIRLHIISPCHISQFFKELNENLRGSFNCWMRNYELIMKSISGYYQGYLKDFFPITKDSSSKKIEIIPSNILWDQLSKNFFER